MPTYAPQLPYSPQLLDDHHDLNDFRSGEPDLDRWLVNAALTASHTDMTRTYVWADNDWPFSVMAYYAIMPTSIEVGGRLRRLRAGNSGMLSGYLLAKMALHENLRGQRLGLRLLSDALRTIVQGSDMVGGRVVAVDALNDSLVSFYGSANFEPSGADPRRLVMTVGTVRKTFDEL